LWIEASPQNSREPVIFALNAIETDAVLAIWTLKPENARQGWVRLSFARAIDDDALSLKLTCHSKGEGWRLGLGSPLPLPDLCCRTPTRGPMKSPLAFRVFVSPPGVWVTTTTEDLVPNDALDTAQAPVALVDFSAVQCVAPKGSGENLVQYNAEEEFVQVHPQGFGKISAARILTHAPERAWRLSAKIVLAHAEAKPTDFALYVSPGDGSQFDPQIVTAVAVAGFGFSGWRKIAPLGSDTLNVYLAPDASRSTAIFFLTRQDQDSAYGWARFSDLQFHTRP
jgi:hypothetical protein